MDPPLAMQTNGHIVFRPAKVEWSKIQHDVRGARYRAWYVFSTVTKSDYVSLFDQVRFVSGTHTQIEYCAFGTKMETSMLPAVEYALIVFPFKRAVPWFQTNMIYSDVAPCRDNIHIAIKEVEQMIDSEMRFYGTMPATRGDKMRATYAEAKKALDEGRDGDISAGMHTLLALHRERPRSYYSKIAQLPRTTKPRVQTLSKHSAAPSKKVKVVYREEDF